MEKESFATELARRRLAAGLSQAKLSRLANVGQATISQVESGDQNPRYSTVLQLRFALDQAGS
jgi:hypothetical protein